MLDAQFLLQVMQKIPDLLQNALKDAENLQWQNLNCKKFLHKCQDVDLRKFSAFPILQVACFKQDYVSLQKSLLV